MNDREDDQYFNEDGSNNNRDDLKSSPEEDLNDRVTGFKIPSDFDISKKHTGNTFSNNMLKEGF
jgi:hypothetical protein